MTLINKYWRLIVITLLGFAIALPLLTKGPFANHDEMNPIRFLAIKDCIEDGQFPCRWSKDLGWGNGFPIFNYYAPGPYYLGAVLSEVVGYINAEKLLVLFSLVAGGMGMYIFVKKLYNENAGFVAGVLYTIAPYKAVDIYVRGALSEAMALAIVPFLFHFAYLLIKDKEKKYFISFSITLFFFLTTHNIMTILFIPLLALFSIIILFKEGLKKLPLLITSGLLGVGLSAFYLLPAFFEKKLVRVDTLTGDYYNFQNHFVSLKQMFISNYWGYGSSGPGLADGMSFQVGYVHWAIALIALLFIAIRVINKKVALQTVLFGIVFILSVFMMHNKSAFIWQIIPLLNYLQFPWRLLSLVIFTSSILGGYVITQLKGKILDVSIILVSVIAIIINFNYFKPEKFYTEYNDQSLFVGKVWEDQRSGILLDYLPVGAIEAREPASSVPLIREGDGIIYSYVVRSNSFSFKYIAQENSLLEIPVYYFPEWELKVDGKEKDIIKSDVGRIMVELEKGSHEIKGVFGDTPLRDFSNLLSLLSFLVLAFLLLRKRVEKINIDKRIVVLALVLSIPAIWSFISKGLYGFSDDSHIGWMYEMDRAVKSFKFPPRFVPDLSYGFGYPLFTFVYPLPFYLGEVFHLLGMTLVGSFKMVLALSIPLSMLAMYKFLREFMKKEYSLLGSVIYVYAPYRATELFVRGAIGEIVAFIFIPLVAWSFVKLTKEKNTKWIAASALSVAALIMSHNIMAYMFMPFALLLLVLRIVFVYRNDISQYVRGFISIIFGLVISIYFWLPAIVESSLMQYSTVFNYLDHFPTLKQLVTPYFGHGASVPGPYDGISFYIGVIGLFIALVGIVHFFLKRNDYTREEKVFVVWGIIMLGVSVFMMNHRSAFIWEAIPLIKYFQFPWRFLVPVIFSLPIFLIAFEKNSPIKYAPGILVILTILVNSQYFIPESFLGRTDDYYLKRFVPYPIASEEYKTTSEEYLRLPLGQTERPKETRPLVEGAKGVRGIVNLNAYDTIIYTDYPQSFVLNYNKYMYPGWTALVDGVPADIKVGSPYGQISLDIPRGAHKIEIYYKETPFRTILNIVSLAGFITAIYLLVRKK